MNAESWRATKQYAQVLGRRMAYVEQGQGEPIVFLHGNPTSSFLWRSTLPEVASLRRCIAPDLIGMGDSEKLPADDLVRYTFPRHRDFLDALFDGLGRAGHPGDTRLGQRARFRLGEAQPRPGTQNRLHGGDRAAVRRLGRLAGGSPVDLPGATIAGR
jgi:hypothetical protein